MRNFVTLCNLTLNNTTRKKLRINFNGTSIRHLCKHSSKRHLCPQRLCFGDHLLLCYLHVLLTKPWRPAEKYVTARDGPDGASESGRESDGLKKHVRVKTIPRAVTASSPLSSTTAPYLYLPDYEIYITNVNSSSHNNESLRAIFVWDIITFPFAIHDLMVT